MSVSPRTLRHLRFPAHFQCLVHGFPTSPTGPTKMEIVYFESCDRYHTPSELHEMARETGPPSSLVSSQSRLPAALLGPYFLRSPRDLKSFAWSSKSFFHPPTSITIQPRDQPSEGYIPFLYFLYLLFQTTLNVSTFGF